MTRTRLAEILMVLTLAVPCIAGADVFRYIDRDGTIHFTDSPTHPGYQLYLKDAKPAASARGGEEYPFRAIILEACRTYHLQEPLLRAVIEVESDGDRYAVSRAGARGLMQLMPDTMRTVGVQNPYDPRQNIMGGAKHLREMLNAFNNNLHLALAAYNAGSKAVVKANNQVPPFPETQDYVKRVLRNYSSYTRTAGDSPL